MPLPKWGVTTMNDLAFSFGEHPVRVHIDDEGLPWWVGKDVCSALDISKYRDALAQLPTSERGSIETDTRGGEQKMAAINEPGLYRLIFTSRKPAAEAFKNWVLHEVLPQIRRAGRYEIPVDAARHDPPLSADYWLGLVREVRLTHGRAAAARIWSNSPLPQVPAMTSTLSDVDQLCVDYLENHCVITGKRHDFVRSSVLINEIENYCMRRAVPWPGDRSVSVALRRVAVMYRDRETGLSMWPVKRSDTGYSGIKIHSVSLFDS